MIALSRIVPQVRRGPPRQPVPARGGARSSRLFRTGCPTRRRANLRHGHRAAFTLIELLVVIAVIALLVGILLPALGAARRQAKTAVCSSRLQQLGVGLALYLNDYDNTLPQAKYPVGGFPVIIGPLFGGKKGSLPFYGINEYGPERRPLNRYVMDTAAPPDDANEPFELEQFKSPADTGGILPGIGAVTSMYDAMGSSYTLNDHLLKGSMKEPEIATLVPNDGGKMPYVVQPTKTWVLGSHPIYNFDGAGATDPRGRWHFWYDSKNVRANLLFLDMHVGTAINVPAGPVQTTRDYTFLPAP